MQALQASIRVLSDRVEELEALRRRCTCKGEGVDKGEGVSRDIEEEGHKGTGVAAVGESVDVRSMGSGVADVVSSGGDPGVERVVVDGKGGPVVGSQGTQSGEWSRVGGSRFWRPQPSKQDKQDQGNKARTEEGVWRMEGSSRVWRSHSGSQDQEGWRKARGGAKQSLVRPPPPVRVSNRFSALALEVDSAGEELEVLVVGDSRVRPLSRTFCGRKDRCVVKPGAKVADVDTAVRIELERSNPERVIVHVGVNNIGPRASVRIVGQYRSLLQRLREARKPVYVTGVLPRLRASNEWYSRALALNNSVKGMCTDMGLYFVDLWDQFFDCDRYYLRDGLHLSAEGARVLGAGYRLAISGN